MATPEIDVCGPMGECKSAAVEILVTPAPAPPLQFNLVKGGIRLATSTSPRALSNWAFKNGANSVAHNYDLRLSPDK